ncbi:MAG: type II 3-dehydroquinate dehydratase [Phenylobacterium sp.]
MSGVVYLLNGPNLNLLGQREPEVYGRATLGDVEAQCQATAKRHGWELIFRQTNREYELVDWIQEARKSAGLVINPAGFSYHAVPVLDALKMCECPVVEVHISNIHRRAETEASWRADSIMSAAATGVIAGLGVHGYVLALEYLALAKTS